METEFGGQRLDTELHSRLLHHLQQVKPASYRYFRLTPKAPSESTLQSLRDELQLTHPFPMPVDWLQPSSRFFAIPHHLKLNGTTAYQQALIFGMDAASGAAVEALRLSASDSVLDLCCAPGTKLCMIAHKLAELRAEHSISENSLFRDVVGIDNSEDRLRVCCQLCKKYFALNVRLHLQDGTTVAPPLSETSLVSLLSSNSNKQRHPRKHSRKVDSTRSNEAGSNEGVSPSIAKLSTLSETPEPVAAKTLELQADPISCENDLFDKILVDAECTHDGSARHMEKFATQWGWQTYKRCFLDGSRIQKICSLQRLLILNAFKLLKVNGLLVYSTCSLTQEQNEGVIRGFFHEIQDKAMLYPLPCKLHSVDTAVEGTSGSQRFIEKETPSSECLTWPAEPSDIEKDPNIPRHPLATCPQTICCARFDGKSSNTSGLFVACVIKVK